jgi:hypothetical protein
MSTQPQSTGCKPPETETVWSISEWCRDAKISEPLLHKKRREGKGPYEASCGRRTLMLEPLAAYYRRIGQRGAA